MLLTLKKYLLLLLILLISSQTYAAGLVVPNQRAQSLDLAPYLELLEDPSGQLDITQVSSADYAQHFVKNTADVPDLGRSHSAWWVRFQLRADTSLERYVLLDRPIGGSVDAFVVPQTAATQLHRLQDYRFPVYRLQLAANETVSVYLRVNNGQALLTLPLKLLDTETLLSSSNTETLVFAGLFAGMLVLALYNLLVFFSLREPANLSLVIFIAAMSLMFFRDSNLFPALAWMNNTDRYFYIAPFALGIASAFHYWTYINQGGNALLARLCHWIPRLMLVILPVVGLLPSVEMLLFGFAAVLLPILLVLVSMTALNGHRSTRNAYWAVLILIIGVTPYVLMQVGWLTYDRLIVYFAQSGILLTLLLLSFAQAEQTRWLREEKERMKATNQAKDSFLTTMSHELRTPIHAITGIAELLRQTLLSAEQTTYLNKLLASSRHLQSLVDNVLDLSRIGEQRLELEITDFRLDEALHTLRQMFSQPATQKGLALSITHDLPADLLLRGDPMRLRQVLVNLLGNALKFTTQGNISLTISQIAGNHGQTRLSFEVIDTGIGISIHQQKRLFKPFSQAESSTTRRYGGTGLGLAISQQLVNLMGGKLEVVSEPDNGSRFFFTLELPVSTPSPVGACPANDSLPLVPQESLVGKQILLVDDDELNLYLGTAMLNKLGATASTADSGQAALKCLQQQTFDLVMMDVSMPDMDGYTTTHHIRKAGYTDLPVIAVTAHALEGERERCTSAGMNDYLTKPFDVEALHRLITSNLMKSN
ncbi:hybrid sensor histidine kinase/response regulator [Thiothrix sp.]|jgi:signal transduction histidine kinase/CheY-like chemotaxis protein|uniref:hybrid sensor histidine kinase/response regulator n=1 Tax=Thiothrix sp. TaxID=1032 RepID=UPI00257CC068|nr:hybrid sensor histidine kinase/response regulator [Thiothrix sp.]